jgi:hypothetical protein
MANANVIVSATVFSLMTVFVLVYGYWLFRRRYYYPYGPMCDLVDAMRAARTRTPVSVNSYAPIMNAKQFLTIIPSAMLGRH